MKILVVWPTVSGCEYHRLERPLKRYCIENDLKPEIHFYETCDEKGRDKRSFPVTGIESYDLVVFNRWMGVHNLEILKLLAQKKVPYVIDIDDYWKLPKHHPVYKYFREQKLDKQIVEGIRYANGVTTTNEELARYIRPINPNVCILPNAIDLTEEQWNERRDGHEGFRIGYIAGVTHHNDAMIVGEPLSRMFKNHGVRTVYGGFHPNQPLCQSIARRLNGTNEKSELMVIGGMNPDKYGMMYSKMDMVIAPLEDTPYNRCKSDIKILEAHAYNLPIVCSNVGAYRDWKGATGVYLTENTPDAWYETMEALYQDLSEHPVGGFQFTQRRDIMKINAERMKFYEQCARVRV